MAIKGITIGAQTPHPQLAGDHMARFLIPAETMMYRGAKDGDAWLQLDDTYPGQIAQRLHYVANKHDVVVNRVDKEGVAAAEIELRDEVVAYLTQTYPEHFTQDGAVVTAHATGVTVDLDQADPMDACAVLASEDLVLMMPREKNDKGLTVYRLESGALVFPSGWSLKSFYDGDDEEAKKESLHAARLGKSMREIHDPSVPHYVNNFMDRVDAGFNHMKPGLMLWRRNWSPMLTDDLFRNTDFLPETAPDYTQENWDALGLMRVEHQTLTKLPRSGAIVFGIKTYQWKLTELLGNDVTRDAAVQAFDKISPEMFAYRENSLPSYGEYLKKYRPA